MAKTTMSASLNAIVENARKRQGENVVSLDDFKGHSITNVMDSIYEKNTILHFPAQILPGMVDFEVFTTNGRTSKAPYIWVDASDEKGNELAPKKVYISQLVRVVTPYKEENGKFVRDGEGVHSDTKLYHILSKYRDAGSILEYCLGKDIQVVNLLEGKTARFTAGVVTGLKDFRNPCFEEVAA